MPFPPGDMVAALSRHLHFQSLEQALLDRHPEVAERVVFDDTNRLMHLKLTLSAGRSVALAQVRMGYGTVWCVMPPELDSEPSVWPLNTPGEVLVDALHAAASARITGEAVASPWRWDESEPSDMTELADLLDGRDLRVRRVVAGNRWSAIGPRHAAKLDIAGSDDGSFVEVEFPDAFVRVSLKSAIGWLVDVYVPEVEAWGRVDLAGHLWGTTSPAPGVPRTEASVAEIADVLGKGLKAWDLEVSVGPAEAAAPDWLEGLDVGLDGLDEDSSPVDGRRSLSPRELTDAVFDQLTSYGFGDVEEGDAETPIRSRTFHIEWHNRVKNLSTSEVQRLNGLAAAAGEYVPKRLIVLTTAGISRPAADFADTAKAFVFFVDRTTGRLMGLNSRAREAGWPDTDPATQAQEPW
ncbi:hypothetical protein ACFYZI_15790 [Streptomyces griseorubiginosus]|uniref:hypothetical protein n=1 Tax=Streptomyces griseorubiginosus TaxID=67304 RepID=UPI003694316E